LREIYLRLKRETGSPLTRSPNDASGFRKSIIKMMQQLGNPTRQRIVPNI
jgi:hypothetical protein